VSEPVYYYSDDKHVPAVVALRTELHRCNLQDVCGTFLLLLQWPWHAKDVMSDNRYHVMMRARLSTRTNTCLQTHIHTHKLKYTLLFCLCQCNTLFEKRVFYCKLIVGIVCFFCLFACCYKTRKSILPPWVGSKVQRNRCFSRLCFFPGKKN